MALSTSWNSTLGFLFLRVAYLVAVSNSTVRKECAVVVVTADQDLEVCLWLFCAYTHAFVQIVVGGYCKVATAQHIYIHVYFQVTAADFHFRSFRPTL